MRQNYLIMHHASFSSTFLFLWHVTVIYKLGNLTLLKTFPSPLVFHAIEVAYNTKH